MKESSKKEKKDDSKKHKNKGLIDDRNCKSSKSKRYGNVI